MSKNKKCMSFIILFITSTLLLSSCSQINSIAKVDFGNKPSTTRGSTPEAKSSVAPSKSPPIQVKKLPVPVVRGVYLNIWTLTNTTKLNEIIKLAKTTELNTVVIDIKGDDGFVSYQSTVPMVKSIGAVSNSVNINNILKLFHNNNIYVIGRVVCFRDPILAKARADLSFRAKDGSLWRDSSGMPWVNPFKKENWNYIVDISKEAIDKGFDEIQFDYVRFGNEGNVSNIDFGPNFDPAKKPDTIAEFLNTAYKSISNEKKAKVSADIFGISAITTADDKNIGQNLEKVAKEVNVICPMLYPSHFANVKQNKVGQTINNITFQKPDLEPYNVIFQTMTIIKKRMEQSELKSIIRPYLQAFTATYLGTGYYQKYGASQVREQIRAVYDSGFKEWILWDSSSNYYESYFEKKK